RVAHIVSTFPPYRGGIGNSAYHLCWELAQLGDRVTVLTSQKPGSESLYNSLPFQVESLTPWLYYGNASFVPQLFWRLKRFDIIHLHYPFFGGAEMVYLAQRRLRFPLVIHYHMDVVGEGLMKKFFTVHTNRVMPRILDAAEKIIVTTIDYAQQSALKERLQAEPHKFIVIPLGVNAEVFRPRMRNRDLIERHRLHNKKVVLFVGGLDRAHYFKGVNYLIKAFQLIASNDVYRLLIVGDGNLRKSFESLAVSFGLERKIIFAGSVSDDWLPLYYNLADVFVLSSIDSSESFGIAALEAMSSGLPVVASDLPGVRSVVQKDVTGLLFKPRHVATLAKHLRFLLENPQVGNEFGVQGRLRVTKQFTWDLIGKQIHNLYTTIPL
ncbi:MAG: hypothetical protein A2677_04340, partial [Candidatus Komeilibacteria bacterium RIFCSPHIGHO2_01_FULL_52_14]